MAEQMIDLRKVRPDQNAFPFWCEASGHAPECGVTKREYFSALILGGVMVNMIPMVAGRNIDALTMATIEADLAKNSVKMADRLIEALNA